MTRKPPQELPQEDPPYRQWLHRLEDDDSVPDYAMQVARIFADYAAKPHEKGVFVTWSTLRRQTHQRRDKLSKAMSWLRGHGWLATAEAGLGQRSYYRLVTPVDNPPDSGPDGGTSLTIGTGPTLGTISSPEGGTTTSPDVGTTNVLTSGTSLSHVAALDAVDGDEEREDRLAVMLREAVPAATPEEIEHAVDSLRKAEANGDIRLTAVVYLRKVIKAGDAPDLIQKARRAIAAEAAAARRGHSASSRDLCKRCGQAGHAAEECPTWLRGMPGYGLSRSTQTGPKAVSDVSSTCSSP